MSSPPAIPGNEARLSPHNYAFLQRFIHSSTGIVIEADKRYLIEARLVPLLQGQQIASLDELSSMLARRPSQTLSRLVIDAMTTNETFFFRDAPMFESLRCQLLPGLLAGIGASRRMRIWSAAASSGQEAYSIAMILHDLGVSPHHVEILGTDISRQVLERARRGTYLQFEVNRGLPAASLVRYFTRHGLEWQIRDEIRSMVRFEEFDLRDDVRRLGSFDLILCRNVLLYFDADTKALILSRLGSALEPRGMLALGCAETLAGSPAAWQRTMLGPAAFYRRTEPEGRSVNAVSAPRTGADPWPLY